MKNFAISLFVIASPLPLIGIELTLPAPQSAAEATLSSPAVVLASPFRDVAPAHSVVAATQPRISSFSAAAEEYARDVEAVLLSLWPDKTQAEEYNIKNIFAHYLRSEEAFGKLGQPYTEETYVTYLTLLLWGAHNLKNRSHANAWTETFELLEWCNKQFVSYTDACEIRVLLRQSVYQHLEKTKLTLLETIDATKEDDRREAVIDLFNYIASIHLYSRIPNCAPTSASVEWFLSIIEAEIAKSDLNSTSERKALEELFFAGLAKAVNQKENRGNRVTQATRPKKARKNFFNFEGLVD